MRLLEQTENGAMLASMDVSPQPFNPLAASLDLLGDRWTLLLVNALLSGPKRFGDLQHNVAGIAPNILTQRLRELEARGLLLAVPYSHRPVRLTYSLTGAGSQLHTVIDALTEWSIGRNGGEPIAHQACGTALELRSWCPTCERIIDAATEELHHL